MKKILLTLLFVLLFIGKADADTIVFSDTFTEGSGFPALQTHTPSPTGTSWTEVIDTCTADLVVDASTDSVDVATGGSCRVADTSSPNASTSDYKAVVSFIDGGTLGTTAVMCSLARYTDTTHYYSLCSVDDSGNAYRIHKMNATDSSLGTGGAFSNGNTDVMTFRMYSAGATRLEVLENGVSVFTNGDTGLTSTGAAGLGCGSLQTLSTESCNPAEGFDNYSVTDISTSRRVMIITDWLGNIIPNTQAQQVRDGRWYVTPVIKVNGVRTPQVAIYDDPGRPLLDDNAGNPTVLDKCRFSANIGNSDIANEWSLVYVSCVDYTNIDAVATNILIADETIDALTEKLSSMPTNRRNKLISNIEKKTGTTGLTADSTVEEWLAALGKLINNNFSPRGTYAR